VKSANMPHQSAGTNTGLWKQRLSIIAVILMALTLSGCAAQERQAASPTSSQTESQTAEAEDAESPEFMAGAKEPIGNSEELPPTGGSGPPFPDSAASEMPADDSPAPTPVAAESGESGLAAAELIRRDGQTTERRGFTPERVYFATNRDPDEVGGENDPDLFFGDERGNLTYGTCEVSIPYRRQPGSLPEPSILRLEFQQDPAKHVVLMEIERLPDAEFWKRLRSAVDASPEKQLMLFVHGYCATFRDAARRTAQMGYDLNYQGPSMFFSWPAGSDLEGFEEKLNYVKDLRRAQESDEDLITVLAGISRWSGAKKLQIVAHSMGNFVLTESLKRMADRLGSAEIPVLFDQAVLAAPDINAREFVERSGRRVRPFSKRLTVYASTEDKALWVSKKVNGYEPLGFLNEFSQSGAKAALFDLVDASQLTAGWFDSGHIYYGDMPELLSDVRNVFRGVQVSSLQRGLTAAPPFFRILPVSR
jgi:esterase/lipase superfamily enzyme